MTERRKADDRAPDAERSGLEHARAGHELLRLLINAACIADDDGGELA